MNDTYITVKNANGGKIEQYEVFPGESIDTALMRLLKSNTICNLDKGDTISVGEKIAEADDDGDRESYEIVASNSAEIKCTKKSIEAFIRGFIADTNSSLAVCREKGILVLLDWTGEFESVITFDTSKPYDAVVTEGENIGWVCDYQPWIEAGYTKYAGIEFANKTVKELNDYGIKMLAESILDKLLEENEDEE